MINDRGMKKWQGMMLTEHVTMLHEFNHEQKKIPKPLLDEYDLHAIEVTAQSAIKQKKDVLLKIWRDGEIVLNCGTIESIDLEKRTLDLDNPFNLNTYLLDEIVDVTILD